MKLSKKLLAGSMALMLGMGNLHAMEGSLPYKLKEDSSLLLIPHGSPLLSISFYGENHPTYNFKTKNYIRREIGTHDDIRHYIDDILYYLNPNDKGLYKNEHNPSINFFIYVLRVNGLYRDDILPLYTNIEISNIERFMNLLICTTPEKYPDFVYNQLIFKIPFIEGSQKIDKQKLLLELSLLMKTTDIVSMEIKDIASNNTIKLSLKNLDYKTGNCTFIEKMEFSGNKKEYQKNIDDLINILEKSQLKQLHVHFIDKIPKGAPVCINYCSSISNTILKNLIWNEGEITQEDLEASQEYTDKIEASAYTDALKDYDKQENLESEKKEKEVLSEHEYSDAEDEDYDEEDLKSEEKEKEALSEHECSDAKDENYDEEDLKSKEKATDLCDCSKSKFRTLTARPDYIQKFGWTSGWVVSDDKCDIGYIYKDDDIFYALWPSPKVFCNALKIKNKSNEDVDLSNFEKIIFKSQNGTIFGEGTIEKGKITSVDGKFDNPSIRFKEFVLRNIGKSQNISATEILKGLETKNVDKDIVNEYINKTKKCLTEKGKALFKSVGGLTETDVNDVLQSKDYDSVRKVKAVISYLLENDKERAEESYDKEDLKSKEKEADNVDTDTNTQETSLRNFNEFFDKYLNKDNALTKDEIEEICKKATDVLKNESSLLEIDGSTIVVGDIHGNLGALEYGVRKFLEANGTKNILFLGDYVDRGKNAPGGPNSIKNVAILLKLKTMFPNKVFLLRGNHEIEDINCLYGFSGECDKAYGDIDGKKVFDKFNSVFNYLPLAAVVDKKTFCVHGGISPDLKDVDQIKDIERPIDSPKLVPTNLCGEKKEKEDYNSLAVDLLWSDPSRLFKEQFIENRGRRAGTIFNKEAASEFLKNNNLERILRAHQEVDGHKDVFEDGSVITLFSAPDYRTKGSNRGEIAEIDGENIEYKTINYNDNKIVKP